MLIASLYQIDNNALVLGLQSLNHKYINSPIQYMTLDTLRIL